MDDATYKIEQRRFLRGRQTLTLEGDKLNVRYSRGLSVSEYRWDLRGLLPDPVRIRQVPTVSIVVLILADVVGLILMSLGAIAEANGQSDLMAGLAGIGFLLLVVGTVGWFPTVKQLANIVLLEGPGGRVVLWPDLPNKEQFDRFLAVLTARIRNAQPQEQNLLRLLRRTEIINDWQFEQAMELLEQRGNAGTPGSPGLDP